MTSQPTTTMGNPGRPRAVRHDAPEGRSPSPGSPCPIDEIFGDLTQAPRWVGWRWETRKGKPTKPPISPVDGGYARNNDPSTWGSLEDARYIRDERGLAGIGIELGGGLGGVDLDACRNPETGEITDWAQEIVDDFGSYTEVSPSQTGLKIYASGAPAELPCNSIPMDTPPIQGKDPKIEVFVTGRYFAVTGEILEGVPAEIVDGGDVGGAWDRLVRRLQEHAGDGGSSGPRGEIPPTGSTRISYRLHQALQGPGKANRIWRNGKDGGGDRSRNDAALAGTLGALAFEDDEIEAAIRLYPLGQIGQGALTGEAADRQVGRLLGIAAEAREAAGESQIVGTITPTREGEPAPRPTIQVREALNAVTDEAVDALLHRPDLGIYVRGRMLVTVGRDGSSALLWLRRQPGSPVIVPIENARMMGILDDAAEWLKWNERKKEVVPARPPDWVSQQILGRLEWPFPYLDAVVETPILRGDGSVLDDPGWDERTGILYDPPPGVEYPPIPENPTKEDVSQAVQNLLDPACDFPFVAESDRAAYVAAVLTLLGRQMIDGPVPLFPIRAPAPGTGKSLLAQVVGIIGTGRTPPAMTFAYEGDELRKRITALAIAGTPLVLLDNLSGSVGSDAFAAALTCTEWEDRILGATQMVRVPLRTVWIATGNNLGFKRTLGRRVVPIDLDAQMETPEDRTTFTYENLLAHVREHRPRLVTAGLTILRAFHRAGRPGHGEPRMGSFESWDDLIRSAVIWAGAEDPAGTGESGGRGRIRAQADDDVESLRAFLEMVHTRFGDDAFSTASLLKRAKEDHELQAVLDTFATPSRGGHPTAHSIGAKLRDHQGRPVGELVLTKMGRAWKVIPHQVDEASRRDAA